jgi:integrase-like protein
MRVNKIRALHSYRSRHYAVGKPAVIAPDRDLAIAEVSDYINTFYNRTRHHAHLGGVSPEMFETSAKRG